MYICTIAAHTDGEEIIYYNPFELGFLEQECIAFGGSCAACVFVPKENLSHTVELSEALFVKLNLCEATALHLLAEQSCVHLGPLLGIFTTGFTADAEQPLGGRTDFFQKLLQIQKSSHVAAYLFGPQHINWSEGTIEGLVYEADRWHTRKMNFPTVIYNRLPNRKVESTAPIRQIKQKLAQEYDIPIFNPNFFHKQEIYQCLLANAETAPLVPKTIPNPNLREMHHFLHTSGTVFLKPQNQSLGAGIVKCMYHPLSQLYYANYYKQGQKIMRKFDRLSTLLEEAVPHFKKENYLIQAGIELMQAEGHPFDFRIHTNRDHCGEWKLSTMAVKIAAKGAPTTHMQYGGKVSVLEALPFPADKIQDWQSRLTQAALQMSRVIARQHEPIGEIGFDFGIDHSEQLWIFEANARPGRSIFSHPTIAQAEQKNLAYIFQFACYLMKENILRFSTPLRETEKRTNTSINL